VYRPAYRDPKTRKQKTASIWWIEFWRDGDQHRESSKSRNASDARKLLTPPDVKRPNAAGRFQRT
jgi:hypothetical protein